MKIRGKIFVGFKGAGPSIKLQEPFLKQYIPEISSMFFGTINVRLEFPISVATYDVETPSIEWQKDRWERFRIIRAEFQLCAPDAKPVPCLLYFAEKSPYHFEPCIVEVVTRQIDLSQARECFIILTQPCRIVVGE
jgi:hypothetical protein